ncbi:MAG: dihydropteroate synthase [Porticoccaceae bacterium]
MGILNVTPDSFSDGGRFYAGGFDARAFLGEAEAMAAAGVHLFDVGGESTRPGAAQVGVDEELARVIPAVRLLKKHFPIPVSVDTSSPDVVRAACAEGADMINDVRALSRPGALAAAAESGVPVCIMHMPAEPDVMQANPVYADVVVEVNAFLRRRVADCTAAGIAADNIVLDPGFGFGKNLEHNLTLFRELPSLVNEGFPVLVGVSRKRMVGEITGREPAQRLAGSLALALLAVQKGVRIVRVHDVAQTVDALKMFYAVEDGRL